MLDSPAQAFPTQSSLAPASPAPASSTKVDGADVLGSLSPSRAADFMTCPMLYRFRTVDRLPEPPSPAALRGTLVHKVLEKLFDLPAEQRTPSQARAMLTPAWNAILEADPDLAETGRSKTDGVEMSFGTGWLASCAEVLDRYFTLEDPRRLEPAEREVYVETLLDSKLLLRGFVDRLDVAANGMVRVVDYKTGRSPGIGFEAKALFQMKFYALVIWRTRGVLPSVLQLVYLGNGEVLRYEPDEAGLLATERKVVALWEAIRLARDTGDWRPNPGRICDWCVHQAICPAHGGTPPPLPTTPDPATMPPAPAPGG